MKNGMRITKDNMGKLITDLRKLQGRDVLVGVPESKTARRGDPLTNATLAYIHDTGSPANNIPARSFMAPGIRDAATPITKYLGAAGKAVLAGKPEIADKAMESAGLAASSAVKARINTGPFEPLAESTLAGRRRRGRTGTKPLIDTAQMRNAITYVVRQQ